MTTIFSRNIFALSCFYYFFFIIIGKKLFGLIEKVYIIIKIQKNERKTHITDINQTLNTEKYKKEKKNAENRTKTIQISHSY